ncbi:hypothetical protein Ahy_A04g020491 [Arachis hypogaea]|uniref:Uncharacterized protein n=1 Tax=Arachis hypogaea TaxID=3818 RepID=A0A445DHU8_ARAHY|nr:hypothetical protein Ahy_A04g020491 [Arachis hypogaea]
MTTILNPMMTDHESKFKRLARQGERHNVRGNNEGFGNEFQNENNVFKEENPYVVPRGQNADENARSRCYVSLPESEIVKIVTMGLGFYIRRKLLNVHIPDLAHLAEKVRQTELIKKEKEKYRSEQRSKSKPFTRKEKVAYVTMESSEEELDFETEVDLAKLKKEPLYSQVTSVYPRAGDSLLEFLVQQKIKDRDISLYPRYNTVLMPKQRQSSKRRE